MIDLHCHLLHGLDDGPKTLQQSILMARAMLEDGITVAVTTPHVYKGSLDVRDRELIRRRIAELKVAVPELEVLPGAEVHVVPDLLDRVRGGRDFFLLGESGTILLEIPDFMVPGGFEEIVFQLRSLELTVVLAHPERNVVLRNNVTAVRDLVDAGTLMQLTDRHLLGSSGSKVEKFCRRMVEEELVHVVASDAHGDEARMPCMSECRDRLRRWVDPEQADALFDDNPRALLQTKPPAP